MKGTVFDVMYVGIMVIVILMTVILATMILTAFKNEAIADENQTFNATYFEQGETSMGVFNIGIIMVFIMGIIGAIVLAIYLETSPVFIAISIIFLVIVVGLAAPILSNMYNSFAGQESIVETSETFSTAKLLIDNLPFFMAVGGGLVIIALYTRLRGEERGV